MIDEKRKALLKFIIEEYEDGCRLRDIKKYV